MKINDYHSYKYLRLAHVTAMIFGFPYNRRKVKESNEYGENLTGNMIKLQDYNYTIYIL